MPKKVGINNNLKKLRKERKLSQSEVAYALCINMSTYSLKETGKSDFTATEVNMLIALFNGKRYSHLPKVKYDDIFPK